MSTSWWLINTFVLLTACPLLAQLKQNQRLEIPVTRNEEPYSVLPAEEDGLILHRSIRGTRGGLQVVYIDTSFQQKWSGILPVEERFQLALELKSNQYAYFLYHQRDFKDINFNLYQLDLSNGLYKKFFVANYIPFSPIQLEVTEFGALIGGYFAGRVPVILYFDFTTGATKVLPGLFNEPGELIQIKANPDNSFNILISAKNHLKQKTLWIKNYDASGGLIQNTVLKPEENSSLLFGRIINLNESRQIVAGVYGARNSDYSKGIFLASLDAESQRQMIYYPFVDLENFFSFMKASRENRVKERIARRKIKGKKLRFQYRFLVHEFVTYQNQYILLGEAFYPKYKQLERNYSLAAAGSMLVFDGYQYTHAIIIGFDVTGNLIWDNSFEINDVKSFTLEQFVKMDVQKDKVALLYLFDNKIRSKIIQNNDVLEGKTFNQLNTQFQESEFDDDPNINKLDYWYAHNFLAYGTKTNPNSRATNQPRRIFFVNKVRYN